MPGVAYGWHVGKGEEVEDPARGINEAPVGVDEVTAGTAAARAVPNRGRIPRNRKERILADGKLITKKSSRRKMRIID